MSEAKALVESFLRTVERRDLVGARTFLSPDFVMIFPGGRRFTALEDLVAWSQTRGRGVRKVFERLDEVRTGDETVIYSFGTLVGQWADGTPFAGIRFLDRFTLRGGRIVEQRVWNDMGEHRPMTPVSA
jgi:ketosteroid isomerase-like protein